MDGMNMFPQPNQQNNGGNTNLQNWMMNPWMFYNPWFMGPALANGRQNGGQKEAQQTNSQPAKVEDKSATIQQTQERQSIPCGIITDPNEIKPAEVPMNGGIGMFVKEDLSSVYIKQWGSDGTIHTIKYTPELSEEVQTQQGDHLSLQDLMDNVNSRFERIEGLISDLSVVESNGSRKGKNNQRQEVGNNE